MKKTAIKQFTIAIAIPVILGVLAAFLTNENMNIYDDIVVPPLAPPVKLFPIVWTILYILMGISSSLVFRQRTLHTPYAFHEKKTTGAMETPLSPGSSRTTVRYQESEAAIKQKEAVFDALYVYATQLFLNFFWSIFFFNMRTFLFAFIWLLMLWIAALVMILKFKKLSTPAGLLQIPYLIWISFAGYLNFAIYWLNM